MVVAITTAPGVYVLISAPTDCREIFSTLYIFMDNPGDTLS